MAKTLFGTMTVIVSAAQGSIPLVGFRVRIRGADEENRDVDVELTTNRSGKTESVELPSAEASLSEKPDPPSPSFYSYNVEVTGEGYYDVNVFSVPVFEGVNTLQEVAMIPEQIYSSDTDSPKGNTDFLVTEKEDEP